MLHNLNVNIFKDIYMRIFFNEETCHNSEKNKLYIFCFHINALLLYSFLLFDVCLGKVYPNLNHLLKNFFFIPRYPAYYCDDFIAITNS